MAITGTGSTELTKLLADLRKFTTPAYMTQMNQSLGAEVLALIKNGFDASTAPDGSSWAAVARGGLPLRKAGILRNAWTYVGNAKEVGAENSLKYAQMMQNGTAGLPGGKLVPSGKKALAFTSNGARVVVRSVRTLARPMVPKEGELPSRWEQKLTATADAVVRLVAQAQGA
jgi:hypothetical protein